MEKQLNKIKQNGDMVMNIAISEIVRYQTDRKLDRNKYDAINEHGNIVEELLESVGLDVPKENRPKLKEKWVVFVDETLEENIARAGEDDNIDAYCDVIVFAIGAIMKLGYDPEKALLEAGKEINSREGVMVDGKFEKDLSDSAKAKWYKANYSLAVR